MLNLGDGRRIHCESLDAAKTKWVRNYSEIFDATIETFFPIGVGGFVVTYRYDGKLDEWVKL